MISNVGLIRNAITAFRRGSGASFMLPLNDAGAGAVNTVPTRAGAPTATFTRATTATTVLSNGLIGSVATGVARSYYDPSLTITNLCRQSQDLSTSWNNSESSESVNVVLAPDGTMTGDKLIEAATTATHLISTPTWVATLEQYTFSVYLKAAERTTARLGISSLHIPGTGANGSFDLVAGTAGVINDCTVAISPAQNGWYRCSITFTPTAAVLGGSFVTLQAGSYAGDGTSGIYVWGAQIERAASASTYVPTTTTAVTVATSYQGYLAEGARTNLLLRSEEFDNASWTKTDTTITANNTTSPDGTVSADLLTEGTAGTAQVVQSITATADVNYAYSVFVKFGNCQWMRLIVGDGGANNFQCYFDVQNGVVGSTAVGGTGAVVGGSIKSYPNGWYRISVVGSIGGGITAATVRSISASSNGGGRQNNATRFEWGAQFENNVSFASSYIPTAGATVTRNADVLTYPFAGNASDTAGTVYAELKSDWTVSSTLVSTAVAFGTTARAMVVASTAADTTLGIHDGTAYRSKASMSAMSTAVRKRATSFGAAGMSVTGDGLAPTANVFDGTMDTVAVAIGSVTGGSQQWFGTIKNIMLWKQQLSNGILQGITA